jgi:ATP-binding cassette subfamily F protein 3
MLDLMPEATEAQRRARLGSYGFSADKADTKCANLSGGEKARLLLALAAFHGPHLLILDEPTNHLDIDSRRALLDALNDYDGAVILITHDRSLIDLVADRLWLTADGHIKPFKGDMDDYARFVLDRVKAETAAPGQKTVSDVVLSAQQAAANEARYAAKKAAKKRRRRGY